MASRAPSQNVLDPRLLPPDTSASYADSTYALGRAPAPREPFGVGSGPKHNGPYYTESRADEIPQIEDAHPRRYSMEGNEEDEQDASFNQDDSKRSRACEACRGLKVRCDQDPQQPDQPCKRCAKAGRQCVITQPSRKRQKKADSRVADLEKKLDALTAALHAQQSGIPARRSIAEEDRPSPYPPPASHNNVPQSPAAVHGLSSGSHRPNLPGPTASTAAPQSYPKPAPVPDMHTSKKRRLDQVPQAVDRDRVSSIGTPTFHAQPHDMEYSVNCHVNLRSDVPPASELKCFSHVANATPEATISRIRQLVEPSLCEIVFRKYVDELAPVMPAVIFPAGTKANQVLETKPILFLCILAAAGVGILHADVMRDLATMISSTFADCVIRMVTRSIELVQALLVNMLWYNPAHHADQANFYQLVHVAACMAIDLGLGRRYNPAKARRGFLGLAGTELRMPSGGFVIEDSDTVEARRTWLACYYLCASVAMVLRRPNMVRWTNYMQECVDFLETSADAQPSDRRFAQYIRIAKIGEDISVSFCMDDSSATSVSISDPKVSYTLDIFEQKLRDWKERLPEDLKSNLQVSFFHDVTELYLHEIAMHVNHNVDDFRMPFTEETLRSGLNHSETLTQKQMAALEACLNAAHRILDTFCSFSVETISGLPSLLFFVRCSYAVIVLIKMHLAVTTPGSELRKIIKPEDIKAKENIDRLWQTFDDMAKADLSKPLQKPLKILGLLKEWFNKHKDEDPKKEEHKKPALHGRNIHGSTGESGLQVLSEAATADSAQSKPNTNWTYESPMPIPYSHYASRPGSIPSPDTNTTSSSTPLQSRGGTSSYSGQSAYALNMQQPQHGLPKTESSGWDKMQTDNLFNTDMTDFDWAAGLDLEQVLDGAFRDIDTSGDLGGWFMGDGVGAYQIPSEGAAPPASNGNGRW